jgi:hypothetical protein
VARRQKRAGAHHLALEGENKNVSVKRTLILLTTLLLAPLAALHAADGLPPFSWDRVPLNLHFGKRTTDLTDAEIEFVAGHSSLIALEKGHGASVHGST